jgi:putative flippase GtrA
VKLTPAGLLEHARSDVGRRAIRYSLTSLMGVIVTQVLLLLFLHVLNWKPIVSNLTAVIITSIPAFLLSKYWVWAKGGKAHVRREVIPFWAFSVAGWALSTLAVIWIVHLTKIPGNPQLKDGNKWAVQGANILGFGVLWVAKYLFLDKVMFGSKHHTPYDEDDDVPAAPAGDDVVTPA